MIECTLCPHYCRLTTGDRGHCGVRMNIDEVLYSLVYGRPCAVHTDPIEKKPIFHMLPGSKAYSIATAGCCLDCQYCQNWQISQSLPEDVPMQSVSPDDIVRVARKTGCASIAYTYTEPTVFYEYMFDTARLAHQRGLKNIFVTCGYINPEPLHKLCSYLDAANVDLKGFSESFYRQVTGGKLQPVLDALIRMKQSGVWVEVTNLVVPGINDDEAMIKDMCVWICDNLGAETPIHFSRFHPAYKLSHVPPTPLTTLQQARSIAQSEGLQHCYIGNSMVAEAQQTYCPQCHRMVIERSGYRIKNIYLKDGSCIYCKYTLKGVWG